MSNPQEQRRHQAVARYLAGDPIETICHEMRCSKSWLYKWKNRYQPDDPGWAPAEVPNLGITRGNYPHRLNSRLWPGAGG